MTLWWIFAAMTAAAVLFVVMPLFYQRRAAATRAAYDITVYKDQLREVERDHARGVLDAEAAKAARLEIERRLLAAADSDEPSAQRPVPETRAPAAAGLRWSLIVALILVPGAALIYLERGAPGLPDQPFAERKHEALPDLAELTRQIEARLQESPDDLRGWALLARAYVRLGRIEDAQKAQARALELLDTDPDGAADAAEIAAGFGELLVQHAQGAVTPAAREAFNAALARDDRNARARYYLALAKMQNGDPKAAVADWKALIAEAPENAPWLESLKQRIEEIEAMRRKDPSAPTQAPKAPEESQLEILRPEKP